MDEPLADYWTRPELAKKLRRSVVTIDTWRHAGEGPPWVRLGSEVLFPKAGVQQWLTSLGARPVGRSRQGKAE